MAQICTPDDGSWGYAYMVRNQSDLDVIAASCTTINGSLIMGVNYTGPFSLLNVNITSLFRYEALTETPLSPGPNICGSSRPWVPGWWPVVRWPFNFDELLRSKFEASGSWGKVEFCSISEFNIPGGSGVPSNRGEYWQVCTYSVISGCNSDLLISVATKATARLP